MRSTHALREYRQWPERERVSSYRKWIACCWVCVLVSKSPLQFGFIVQLRRQGMNAGVDAQGIDHGRTSPPSVPIRVGAYLLAVIMLLCANAAFAYRPFDGTDAAVADPGEMEVELQPAGGKSIEGQKTLIAPDFVLNYG